MKIRINKVSLAISAMGLLASLFTIPAYAYIGNVHGHAPYGPHHGHRGGYYERGGVYLGGGFGGPNVIINVPAENYYAPPLCQNVEVCDNYRGVCWLERRCE